MRSVFFIPPLKRGSGGLAQIYSLAEALLALGYPVACTSPGDEMPDLDALERRPEALAWGTLRLGADDLWIVPESWPLAFMPGQSAGVKMLLYAQSWVYMLTNTPPGGWGGVRAVCLAVSEPVRWFMETVMGMRVAGVLPPALDEVFFHGQAEAQAPSPGGVVSVAWAPRKNKALSLQIQKVAEHALRRQSKALRLHFRPLEGLSPAEVAAELSRTDIFLSTGFPEGFGLMPLEAMACGCVPVGFSGLGGFDYMRGAQLPDSSDIYDPPFSLPDKGWGPNGFYQADGDVLRAGLALAQAALLAADKAPLWQELRRNARLAAQAYSVEKRATRLAGLWPELEKLF